MTNRSYIVVLERRNFDDSDIYYDTVESYVANGYQQVYECTAMLPEEEFTVLRNVDNL